MKDAAHPLGLIDNPEWAATRYRREALYLEERARRTAKPRPEWQRPSFVLVLIPALLLIVFAYVGGVS